MIFNNNLAFRILISGLVLEAAHELPLAVQLADPHVLEGLNPGPFLQHDLVPVAALELALGAIELAGPVQRYPQ